MDHGGPGEPGPPSPRAASLAGQKKTAGLLTAFEALWSQCGPAFKTEESFARAGTLALGSLACLGRRTITGFLCAAGRQFRDWSADYRVFSERRVEPDELFSAVRRRWIQTLDPGAPMVAAMDDTILRKTGKRTPGVKRRRDPLGPPFHVNFVRGQRALQISGALPPKGPGAPDGPARMVPMDFAMASTPQRPRKAAPAEEWKAYEEAGKRTNINRVGAARLEALRRRLDAEGARERPLWLAVDGAFTNSAILKNLPERTVLIGRIRGDAKLHRLPEPPPDGAPARGRRRAYGELAPTPEACRQDPDIPWRAASLFAAGKRRLFRYKTLAPLRWRSAGSQRDLRLVVVAPLGYRLRKGSKLLYRKPAHIVATDPSLPVAQILQACVWRWEVEVNFRDEKTILGTGEAQVWSDESVQVAPAFLAAAYAMLLMAAAEAFGAGGKPLALPAPKWRRGHEKPRPSTQDMIQLLRWELWGTALEKIHFSGFKNAGTSGGKPEKTLPSLRSAVLYAAR